MSVESTELVLFLDNDEMLWKFKSAIFRSLATKKDRSVYDRRLAPKAFVRLTTEAAKKYIRDFGSPGDKWNHTFSPVDRRHAAVQLVEQFEAWYAADYQSTKKA